MNVGAIIGIILAAILIIILLRLSVRVLRSMKGECCSDLED